MAEKRRLKTKVVGMRLTPFQARRLADIADARQQTPSEVMRDLLTREIERTSGYNTKAPAEVVQAQAGAFVSIPN